MDLLFSDDSTTFAEKLIDHSFLFNSLYNPSGIPGTSTGSSEPGIPGDKEIVYNTRVELVLVVVVVGNLSVL